MQEVHTAGERGVPRVELPKKLGVAVPPGHDIEPVWNLLVAAGFSPDEGAGRTPVLADADSHDFKLLPDWLQQHSDGHVLLLFNAPVPTIARLMADAVEPGEAVAQWQKHAEQVLDGVRRNRRRMTLIALETAQADPAAFTDLLGDRFGLALKRPVDTIEAGQDPGAVFRMMAENAVRQAPDVRSLAAELEANALPLPPMHGLLLPAVEEVYSEFNQRVESTQARKKELEEENERLRQQLHQVQQELEATVARNQQANEEAKYAQTDPSQDQVLDDSATHNRIRELEEENELLLQQLHHVQEELESYYLSGTDARHELEEARATIESLYNSKSWKLTRPLRFMLDLFTGHRGETR